MTDVWGNPLRFGPVYRLAGMCDEGALFLFLESQYDREPGDCPPGKPHWNHVLCIRGDMYGNVWFEGMIGGAPGLSLAEDEA